MLEGGFRTELSSSPLYLTSPMIKIYKITHKKSSNSNNETVKFVTRVDVSLRKIIVIMKTCQFQRFEVADHRLYTAINETHTIIKILTRLVYTCILYIIVLVVVVAV